MVVLNSVTPGSTLEGYVKTSYEFTAENPAVEGGISIPITDTLSIRIAARYSDQLRGYVTNYAQPTPDPFDPGNLTLPGAAYRKGPDVRNGIARFTAVWKPADNFDATFKVLWSYYRDRGSGIDGDEVFTCGTKRHPTTVNLLSPLQAYHVLTAAAWRIMRSPMGRLRRRSWIISSAPSQWRTVFPHEHHTGLAVFELHLARCEIHVGDRRV